MLKVELHKVVMVNILRHVYEDKILQTSLGFKGGTAVLLFYNLPRFSIDLDFDLLKLEQKTLVFERIGKVLTRLGQLKEQREKRQTLFFLLNYEKGQRNIKVEVSLRADPVPYQPKNYLGISMLVMGKKEMFAAKLAAYLTRKKLATRDMYDLWYFCSQSWSINPQLLQAKTGFTLKAALQKAIVKTKTIKEKALLSGLGELLDNKQKDWVRTKLKKELIFQLQLYSEMYK